MQRCLLFLCFFRCAAKISTTGPAIRTCIDGHYVGGRCVCSWPLEEISLDGQSGCGVKDCGNGQYNFSRHACVCNEGFAHAGVTNPINKASGRCTQYQCQNDDMCAAMLNLNGATCPVIGWNCDCGIWEASSSTARAQCMYPWWALLSKISRWLAAFIAHGWKLICFVAFVMLPFGKNIVGSVTTYSMTVFWHDFAWTLFIIQFGFWLYVFLITWYLVLLLAWAAIVAVVVIAVLVALALIACLTVCEGGGAGAAGCEGFSSFSCAECCAGSEFGTCCTCCTANTESPAMLYAFGDGFCLYPGTVWGPGNCSCHRCNCHRATCCWSCMLFVPCFRILAAFFPRIPENMLGGFVGWTVGTHPRKNSYNPNSPIVRLLASPCFSVANRSETWRLTVQQWLYERDAFEATAEAGLTVAEARRDTEGSTRFGDVIVQQSGSPFSRADGIFNFEDYESNRCWICQDSSPTWDLWVSCRHTFCNRCSSEMLRRRMPCPMCRVRSTQVLQCENDLNLHDEDVEEARDMHDLIGRPSSSHPACIQRTTPRTPGNSVAPQQILPLS